MRRFSKRIRTIDTVLFTLLLICGCTSSADLISGVSVEDKVARLKLGKTDKAAVEGIFGVEHGNDRNRWTYNLPTANFKYSIADKVQELERCQLPLESYRLTLEPL